MLLFLSKFLNKVDKKGRVSVPASFRAALPVVDSFHGMVAFPSPRYGAIEGFSMLHMQKLSTQIDTFALFSDQRDHMAAALFAESHPLSFDPEGRVLLPPDLLKHAGIDDQALFVGQGSTFQIWHPDTFKTHYRPERSTLEAALVQLKLQGEATP